MGAKQSSFKVPCEHFNDTAKLRQAEGLNKSRNKYIQHRLSEGCISNDPEQPEGGVSLQRTRFVSASQCLSGAAPSRKYVPGSGEPEENGETPFDSLQRRKSSFKPLGRYDRSASFHDETDRQAELVKCENYTFFFENLVFEGGGNKGLAYCGAVRALEDLGLMHNIKRFAGASAGGMFAGLLAVGYNSDDIEKFLSDRIDKVFLDASCGYCSLLPNLVRSFGWNPGNKIYTWFGNKIKEKTGDADITFQQVYNTYGKQLCIIVTNLNHMTTEYCHIKTTPDMPIRTAIRMSMAIPGLFSAIRYKNHGNDDVFVDGGVLCNYPIHCFDGWYLSTDPDNSFVRRLQPLRDIPLIMERSNRFGDFNDKTLGMLLYSDAEEDILRMKLETRVGCLHPAKPSKETKLYRQHLEEVAVKRKAEREHAKVVEAVDSFLRVLKKHDIDSNDVINRKELEAAFNDETEFPREQAEVLFGKDFTVNEAFSLLDHDNNGKIHYEELVRFIEDNGVSLQSRFLGYKRKEITNLVSFMGALLDCLTFNVIKLYVEARDMGRTVGINTGHVTTTDFILEEPDREFIVKRGYNSMMAFLQYYVVQYPDKVEQKQPRCGKTLSVPVTVEEEKDEDLRLPEMLVFPEVKEQSASPPQSPTSDPQESPPLDKDQDLRLPEILVFPEVKEQSASPQPSPTLHPQESPPLDKDEDLRLPEILVFPEVKEQSASPQPSHK